MQARRKKKDVKNYSSRDLSIGLVVWIFMLFDRLIETFTVFKNDS